MWSFRKWRRARTLRRFQIPDPLFQKTLRRLPLFHGLDHEEQARLCDLATLFLHEKSIEAAGGLELDESMQLLIALQACLPILNLGVDWYDGWISVIVYPSEFVPEHTWMDEAGVEHRAREPMIGEAWLRGPVILSWDDLASDGWGEEHNVVIHELAHKLDGLDGEVNGLPPLHPEMPIRDWAIAFTEAYRDLKNRLDRDLPALIDPYAAESPAEFFAVLSELFFTGPALLQAVYPEVYAQLKAFYRQDPGQRFPG